MAISPGPGYMPLAATGIARRWPETPSMANLSQGVTGSAGRRVRRPERTPGHRPARPRRRPSPPAGAGLSLAVDRVGNLPEGSQTCANRAYSGNRRRWPRRWSPPPSSRIGRSLNGPRSARSSHGTAWSRMTRSGARCSTCSPVSRPSIARAALREVIARAGHLDLVRVVAGAGGTGRARMTADERVYLVGQLAGRADWPGMWRLAPGRCTRPGSFRSAVAGRPGRDSSGSRRAPAARSGPPPPERLASRGVLLAGRPRARRGGSPQRFVRIGLRLRAARGAPRRTVRAPGVPPGEPAAPR
jgi:hypothetical protein